MYVNDNIMYLCVVATVVAAAIFVWLAYDSSSITFIWTVMNHEFTD